MGMGSGRGSGRLLGMGNQDKGSCVPGPTKNGSLASTFDSMKLSELQFLDTQCLLRIPIPIPIPIHVTSHFGPLHPIEGQADLEHDLCAGIYRSIYGSSRDSTDSTGRATPFA